MKPRFLRFPSLAVTVCAIVFGMASIAARAQESKPAYPNRPVKLIVPAPAGGSSDAIATHPAVTACAVIGIPHAVWGESVHAIVVPLPGATLALDELQTHCKSLIAGYKAPRSLELRSELPLSAVGKVMKNVLRQPYRPPAESFPHESTTASRS